jgi:hypothetical protein
VAAGWAAAFARFPAGSRAAFVYHPHPESVVLDLALQGAGLVAVPQGRPEQQEQPIQAGQVEIAGEAVRLPPWQVAEGAGAPVPDAERMAGGGVVVGEAVFSQEDLAAAAGRLGRGIPEMPVGRRHVLVLSGFAGDPAERFLLTWATRAGAALLLEPEPAQRVATAVWARPTVFAGTVEEILRLRAAVERDETGFRLFRRRRRLPFGRLRAVLATAGEMPPEETAFWEERGVRAGYAAERQERGI